MGRREHIEAIRRDQRRRVGAHGCRKGRAGTGARVDGLDQARVADRDVDKTARRIEEGCIRAAGKRPVAAHVSAQRIELDESGRRTQRTGVAVDGRCRARVRRLMAASSAGLR
jgi:hypothetical protein